MAKTGSKTPPEPLANLQLLEQSWEEKFLEAAINLQGSSSSCETFFREKGDPEATSLATVSQVTSLVEQVLKLETIPSVEKVSDAVLKNEVVLEYLDLIAHTPWNTPEELVNSSEHVLIEAKHISSLAMFGFHFDVIKIPGRGKQRGIRYGPVLATIAKAANMDHSLTSTSVCTAARAGDLLELRWYARRAGERQDIIARSHAGAIDGFGIPGRSLHAPDREGRTPLHHAAAAGKKDAVAFLLDHWALVHVGAPDDLLDFYEDEENNEKLRRSKSESPIIYGPAYTQALKLAEDKKEALEAKQAMIRAALDPEQQAAADAADSAALVLRKLLNVIENRAGNTPLHECCQQGHYETVQLLIKRGAAVDRKNFLGRTPLACAAANNVDELVSRVSFFFF
mmetsp:Transcript_45718/g.58709  ORF Transcript_45718/g.58709 Transcript_45718/m.58709 type:complete len:397 (+) Transcript_45718:20-1210(+)